MASDRVQLSFEHALLGCGRAAPPHRGRHQRAHVRTTGVHAGREFSGPLVVSMRPIPAASFPGDHGDAPGCRRCTGAVQVGARGVGD